MNKFAEHKMPVHEWGGGFATKYEPASKIHRIYLHGQPIGTAWNTDFFWMFNITGAESFRAQSLPEGMTLLTRKS